MTLSASHDFRRRNKCQLGGAQPQVPAVWVAVLGLVHSRETRARLFDTTAATPGSSCAAARVAEVVELGVYGIELAIVWGQRLIVGWFRHGRWWAWIGRAGGGWRQTLG